MSAVPAHRLALYRAGASSDARDERLSAGETAIAHSVLYASLFDYPLTLAELRQTLVESTQTPSQMLSTYTSSPRLQERVEYRDGFFFPKGRHDLVAERRRREHHSREFLEAHRAFLAAVTSLPYVSMVALSGSVAHLNVSGSGDLDLFIVTRGRRVWSITVAIILLAKLLGRRKTVCANFVMADTRLVLDQPDLFTASQVIHLKPLIGEATFRRLLAANPFVRRCYPNFHESFCEGHLMRPRAWIRALKRAGEWGLLLPWLAVEPLCRLAYRTYLRRKSASWESPEQVRLDADCLKLHTKSHRRSVLERFEELTSHTPV